MTGTVKLAYTAVLFAVALGLLATAGATHSAVPLFLMWLPLFGVPWVLARPEPGASPSTGDSVDSANQDDPDQERSPEP